jgi:hypothetical protein
MMPAGCMAGQAMQAIAVAAVGDGGGRRGGRRRQ